MRGFMKHTVCSIVFAAGLIILLMIASWILVPKGNNTADGMRDSSANGILAEPDHTIDVLVLGDSESYSSIVPLKIWEQYGITSYCCGTTEQKLCYSQDFLYKAFDKQNPKVVILETDAIYRNVTLGESLLFKVNRLLPVFGSHNRWKTLKAHDFDLAVNYTYIDNAKGYKFSNKTAAASADGYMAASGECAYISNRNHDYVEKFKEYCEEMGAKLILVSTPSTVDWNMPRHNGVQKLADELGLEYIDMNLMPDEVAIDWSHDTRDQGDHLNYYGAEKVTAYIGAYLADTGLLTNHKKDEAYHEWNMALDNFNQTIAPLLAN